MFSSTLAIALLLVATSGVQAWGASGHQAVGFIAMEFLSPGALRFVQTSLNASFGRSLGPAATVIFSGQMKFVHSLRLLDNPPSSCSLSERRDCTNGACVLTAIANFTSRVVDTRLDSEQRQEALLFLDHFIGDIGQPLHVEAEALGGNQISARCNGASSNLHSVWDSGIINRLLQQSHGNSVANWVDDLVARIKTGSFSSLTRDWLSCTSTTQPAPARRGLEVELRDFLESRDITPLECPLVWGGESNQFVCPLINELARHRFGDVSDMEKRVPLMTDDDTVAPLIDLQVFAPPAIPKSGSSCTVELLKHSFGVNSYNAPAVVPYVPPTSSACGKVGEWAAISMNLSVYSIGTQYDRLGAIYLSHTESPSVWNFTFDRRSSRYINDRIKDMTQYTPIFSKTGDLMMDFSNIIDSSLLLDAAFDVTLSATFYAPTKDMKHPISPDAIIPLSNLSPSLPNFFTINNDNGATINITLPETTEEAYVEVFASGNSAEEFWYLNTPDEFLDVFPPDAGLIGKGPFREVQILVDDQLAGVIWPHAMIYTGGITPSNWRPLTSFGAYDQPTYWVSITPFLPLLLSQSKSKIPHTITLKVQGQGKDPSINSNWFVSGSVHIKTGKTKVTGRISKHVVEPLEIETTGGASTGNTTLHTKVTARRKLVAEAELFTSGGRKTVSFTQDLEYINEAEYSDNGWVQVRVYTFRYAPMRLKY
ncbi:hypothetical protein ONZ45_g13499 [Pleurotus djamor]|nr:hypothetical protein ONZ45_g13499 [Pleurotus djamor]